jgi:hypothetical protein
MERTMDEAILLQPVELTDAELDAVSGGLPLQVGLVNAVVKVTDALNNNSIANGNSVAVGVLSGLVAA